MHRRSPINHRWRGIDELPKPLARFLPARREPRFRFEGRLLRRNYWLCLKALLDFILASAKLAVESIDGADNHAQPAAQRPDY